MPELAVAGLPVTIGPFPITQTRHTPVPTTETHPVARVAPPTRRRRRRWNRFQKLVIALLTLAALLVFAAIAYLTYTERRIERIPEEELTSLQIPVGGEGPINFLVVGTDSRVSLPEEWDDYFGDFAGARADVIMLAHLVPGERIQLLSVPRDLRADIPGHGTNRINAAFALGGPNLLVQAVGEVTGIPIHHYVEIDFGGFGEVVDSLGGVVIDFEYPSRDRKSGFQADAGRQRLDGEMALAYARSRTVEVLRDGEWRGTGGGDIARTRRQQQLLVQLFDQVTSPSSAFSLPGFLPAFADQVTADAGLSLGLMADLARSSLAMRSGDIEEMTLPVESSAGSDGRSYVVPIQPQADGVLAAFRDGEPFPES